MADEHDFSKKEYFVIGMESTPNIADPIVG